MIECEELGKKAFEKGVIEALIMTGEGIDKHPVMKKQLKDWGFNSYASYTAEVCKKYLEIGLLPHTNIGTLEEKELEILKPYNVSMGMMVETTSEKATKIAHSAAPTKKPSIRLSSLREAGKLRIPFTTGILIGIGESYEDRIKTLESIGEIHSQFGHIQEVILQPLNQQEETPMANWEKPNDEKIEELIPFVKEIMPDVHIQIPPNLVDNLFSLIEAGADDLGGIAPEPDHINPNKDWPNLSSLESELKDREVELKLRMPVYDEYIKDKWCPKPTIQALNNMLAKNSSPVLT